MALKENPLALAIGAATPDLAAEEAERILRAGQAEEERLVAERKQGIKNELERLKGCVDDDTFMAMIVTTFTENGPHPTMWGDREVLVASAIRVVRTYQRSAEKARKEAEGAGLILPAGVQRPDEDNGPRIIVPGT